jgi:hypothetical protein
LVVGVHLVPFFDCIKKIMELVEFVCHHQVAGVFVFWFL